MTDDQVLQRLSRVEDRLDIGQLPMRYALAVDQRDVGAWVSLFVPTVSVGRFGTGREALRAQIEPELRKFYRSIHQIVGHRIEIVDDAAARGQTYCRAEHEVGDRWIVMAIRYDDRYAKVDGDWLFASRRERHWYAIDLVEHPQSVGFNGWTPTAPPAELPHLDAAWSSFWSGHDVETITQHP